MRHWPVRFPDRGCLPCLPWDVHLSFDTREGGRGGGEIDKTHCFGGEYLAMKEETITLGSGKEASSMSEIKKTLNSVW